jgi:hypothetical protein
MTCWVTREDGVVEDFTRSDDHYITRLPLSKESS